jgi:membrane-bound ClpP family serine protease
MWIITGVLLGMVCLATAIGFHTGPHTHSVAAALGALGAGWIGYLLVSRGAGPVIWSLLGADLFVAAGVGALAWKGLPDGDATGEGSQLTQLEGLEGVAVSELAPEGIVRVRGELWSAVSLHGAVLAGSPVQVFRHAGVRLEVWCDEADVASLSRLFVLEEASEMEVER